MFRDNKDKEPQYWLSQNCHTRATKAKWVRLIRIVGCKRRIRCCIFSFVWTRDIGSKRWRESIINITKPVAWGRKTPSRDSKEKTSLWERSRGAKT